MEDEKTTKPEKGYCEPLKDEVPRGRDINIKLGVNPDELEACIRTIAYQSGYTKGIWDMLGFMVMSAVFMYLALFWNGNEPK